jgi:hypothetical protein
VTLQRAQEELGKVCCIVFVPELFTSVKCVRCRPVEHSKRHDYMNFDKQRVGTCPHCGLQMGRDVQAGVGLAEVGWQWMRDGTRPAHLDAPGGYVYQRGLDAPGWSSQSPAQLVGVPYHKCAEAAGVGVGAGDVYVLVVSGLLLPDVCPVLLGTALLVPVLSAQKPVLVGSPAASLRTLDFSASSASRAAFISDNFCSLFATLSASKNDLASACCFSSAPSVAFCFASRACACSSSF